MTSDIPDPPDGLGVLLRGGWLDEAGASHHDAAVRPVRGEDEQWLYALPLSTPEARVVTELLARCVSRVGPGAPSRETVRELPVGDREWLVAQLWRATFGDRVELVLTCPRQACGARMDVDFALSELPVEGPPQQPDFPLTWGDGDDVVRLRFRLPRGSDLEALGRAAAEGVPGEDLQAVLLSRCVLAYDSGGENAALSPGLMEALMEATRRGSALMRREFGASCPECGREFAVEFDPILSFLTEMLRRRPEFERDVHLLSLYYHWPLSEILAMSRVRRRRFVEFLLDRLEPASVGR
ncbi:T4 family baseplate hub assembly chaperone [Nonomuraea endophytica]|uniref:T4 family baseplate hub assembly chaperone n=1 Tax=Nonomuraea endophytica TaxID=714136 RepID=UPI0037CC9B82